DGGTLRSQARAGRIGKSEIERVPSMLQIAAPMDWRAGDLGPAYAGMTCSSGAIPENRVDCAAQFPGSPLCRNSEPVTLKSRVPTICSIAKRTEKAIGTADFRCAQRSG